MTSDCIGRYSLSDVTSWLDDDACSFSHLFSYIGGDPFLINPVLLRGFCFTLDWARNFNSGMKYFEAQAVLTQDKKTENERRFRNILANSGKEMESGEVRDLNSLYVMSRKGTLIKITDLNTNPDKQTEKYSVKFVANHGHNDIATGEREVGIEDIIGDAKVWMEADGLHARVYFANDDPKADHAYAISDNASYSIGTEWFEDGYYGAGQEIDGFVGILREISMVDVGNDPRAYTLDHKPTEAEAQGSAEEADGKEISNVKEENEMPKIEKDELTPDENKALKNALSELVDNFTTDVPEGETEPTAREAKDEEGEAPAEAPAEEKKDVLRSPVVIIRDKAVKQEKAVAKADWLHSEAGHVAFADTLKKAGRLGATFDAMWRAEASKHMNLDGVSGLPNPAPVEQYFINAIEKGDGIINHFQFINAKSFRVHLLTSSDRAAGHKKGDTKANQSVTDTTRDLLVKMVYKKLDLDATELYENPWLIDFRSQELVNAIISEIERAAIVGDGRTAPSGDGADYRMFDGTRGFYSVLADATAVSGIGTNLASSYTGGENLYDGVVGARGSIKTEGAQILIAKSSAITSLLQAKSHGAYLVAPGASIENILGVQRVYTPTWMDSQDVDAILLVNNAYKHGGENGIRVRTDFDTTKNTDILLDETPRFGSLGEYKSAVAITVSGESES